MPGIKPGMTASRKTRDFIGCFFGQALRKPSTTWISLKKSASCRKAPVIPASRRSLASRRGSR